MVRWGSVELPELEFGRTYSDPLKKLTKSRLLHVPTGLRLETTPTLFENRGEWRDFLICAPEGEDWRVRVSIYDVTRLTRRVEEHFGVTSLLFGTPIEDQNRMENAYLREFGHEYSCSFMAAEPGYSMPDWTAARRDAVLLMLLWWMETPFSSVCKDDPYPSKLTFKELNNDPYQPDRADQKKLPAAFSGQVFKSPAWERL